LREGKKGERVKERSRAWSPYNGGEEVEVDGEKIVIGQESFTNVFF